MKIEEKIKKAYIAVIEGEELTTQKLYSCGFAATELSKLAKTGVLKRVSYGHYTIGDYHSFRRFGEELMNNGNYLQGSKCLKICQATNNLNEDELITKIIELLRASQYNEAFNLFIDLMNINLGDQKYCLCLWLFSVITKLPDDYLNVVLNYEPTSFNLPNSESIDYTQIIQDLWHHKFGVALKEIDQLPKDQKTIYHKMLFYLTISAEKVEKTNRLQVTELIANKDYEGALTYLDNLSKTSHLGRFFVVNRALLNDLMTIKATKQIPLVTNEYKTRVTANQAIKNHDYQRALDLLIKSYQQNNSNYQRTAYYLLLKEIIATIEKIKQDKSLSQSEPNSALTPDTETVTIDDIYSQLINHNIGKALELLRPYLANINKREYEEFLVNLIKIDVSDEDAAFTRTIAILSLISRDNYWFDADAYFNGYRSEMLSAKKSSNLEEKQKYRSTANLYLNILATAKENGWFTTVPDDIDYLLQLTMEKRTKEFQPKEEAANLKFTYPAN